MKIKVKLVGEYFPDYIQGTIQEVEISSVVESDGTIWTVTNSHRDYDKGYEIELVEEGSEDKSVKKGENTIDFGDNELKTLTVEFK